MNKISTEIQNIRSKISFSQPVYIPGYVYSPWKKWVVIILIAVVLSLIVVSIFNSNKAPIGSSQNIPLQETTQSAATESSEALAPSATVYYPVDQVVDGDTIDVSINNKVERIRLIGMDTPETKDPRKPIQCFGKEATAKLQQIVQNKKVALASDPTQGDRDKYQRLLRYALLEDGTNVANQMIREGYAHEYTYNIPYKYQSDFKTSERLAREASVGLWSPNTCSGDTTKAAAAPAPTPIAPVSSVKPTPSASTACDPNYTPCIPNVSGDLDCGDISTSVAVIGTDRHRFDRDGDGSGCESNG